MSIRGFSESNYLHRAAAVRNEMPFRVMAKVRMQSSNEDTRARIFRQGIGLADTDLVQLFCSSQGAGFFGVRQIPGGAAQASDHEAILGTWVTVIGDFQSNSSRHVMSTFSRDTNTSVGSLENATDTYLGALSEINPDTFKVAEVSVWDSSGIGWFDSDAAFRAGHQMKANRHPLEMNEDEESEWYGRLVAYWPLDNLTTGIQDHSGNGHHMSVVGTLIVDEDHPLYAGETTPTPPRKRIIIG